MTDDAMGDHQRLHPFVVHPPAAPPQRSGHPRRAVGAGGASVDAADLGDQGGLGLLG
jgi:hypothetical protein